MTRPRSTSAGASTLELPDCPICGAGESEPAYRFDPFGVVRCGSCGVHYLRPRLPESAMIELYRSGDYFEAGSVGYDSYAEQEPALRATFRRVVRRLVRSRLAGGDLLDVGCGYGYFLDEARGAFASRVGTEFSDGAAAHARSLGLDVVSGGIDELPADAAFDCIVGTHVIEHVYDPRAFVGRLHALLRPGGTLLLATPDMASGWRRFMGRHWPSFKVPEHVVYLDGGALGRLYASAGLEAVETFPFQHAFPLALIARRLNLPWPAGRAGRLARLPIWVPGTTVALTGRRSPDGGSQRADW